jgi:hypothetical protein
VTLCDIKGVTFLRESESPRSFVLFRGAQPRRSLHQIPRAILCWVFFIDNRILLHLSFHAIAVWCGMCGRWLQPVVRNVPPHATTVQFLLICPSCARRWAVVVYLTCASQHDRSTAVLLR